MVATRITEIIDNYKNKVPFSAERYMDQEIETIKTDLYDKIVDSILDICDPSDGKQSLFRIYQELQKRKDIKLTPKGYKHISNLTLCDMSGSLYFVYQHHEVESEKNIGAQLYEITELLNALAEIVQTYGSFESYIEKEVDEITTEIIKTQKIIKLSRINNVSKFGDLGFELASSQTSVSIRSEYEDQPNLLTMWFSTSTSTGDHMFYSKLKLSLPTVFLTGKEPDTMRNYRKDLKAALRKYMKFLEKYSGLYKQP